MRKVDAPRAGWYPDPEHSTSLRWWDGLDWTDIRRSPPSDAELLAAETAQRTTLSDWVPAARQQVPGGDGFTRQDAQEIIAEVRNVARAEVDRAAQEFTERAANAARSFTPLISEYTNRVVRWVRFGIALATVLFLLWFAFQLFAQQSLFDWIGDRIDNLTDNDSGGSSGVVRDP